MLAAGGTIFFMMPWMWRHLVQYTLMMFSDFHGYLK